MEGQSGIFQIYNGLAKGMTRSEKETLQFIENEIEMIQPEQAISYLNDAPEFLQDAYQESQPPEVRLNGEGKLIDLQIVFHPRINDKGERAIISHPTAPPPLTAFGDPDRYDVMLPND